MALYRRTYLEIPVYQFLGDDYEWRRLIIGNVNNFKNIYLLDCTANRRIYPPEIKVINSSQTIKRINFTELNKSMVFIGDINQKKWLSWNWRGASCMVIRTDLKYLLDVMHDNLVEKSSRRNTRYLKKYK